LTGGKRFPLYRIQPVDFLTITLPPNIRRTRQLFDFNGNKIIKIEWHEFR